MPRTYALLIAVLFPCPLLAQVIMGGSLTPERLEPRFTMALTVETLSGFRSHLDRVGDLTLDKATLILPDSPTGPRTYTLVARKLQFDNSRVITNGNTLEIFAEEIVGDSASQIVSFTTTSGLPPNEPSPGTLDGPHGLNGRNASDITIYTAGDFRNKMTLSLRGQDGQAGTTGQAGSIGTAGARGRPGRCAPIGTGCRRGPGDGRQGGAGGTGGRGGNSGAGGNGGNITIVFFNKAPVQNNLPIYANEGGRPGAVGQGGQGGPGGLGGAKGNRGPCCHGNAAHDGRTGSDGARGTAGSQGAHGFKGQFVAKRQDIPV